MLIEVLKKDFQNGLGIMYVRKCFPKCTFINTACKSENLVTDLALFHYRLSICPSRSLKRLLKAFMHCHMVLIYEFKYMLLALSMVFGSRLLTVRKTDKHRIVVS